MEPNWQFVLDNLGDIRNTVMNYLPVEKMQSMKGPFGPPSNFNIGSFDDAVEKRDVDKFLAILNDAWLRAPESRSVYDDPGFRALCDICDGTVEGFIPDYEDPCDEEEEPPF